MTPPPSLQSSRDWWRIAAPEVRLYTAEEIAELDRRATESGAIPERALIENAGRALAIRLQTRWPEGRVLALAGSGHNGADALVAARTLSAWGREVELVACGSSPPEPDVLAGWDLELADGGELEAALSRAEIVIDGILGTGVRSAPRPPQARAIELANGAAARIVAVDGPSGIDFTTGATAGAAIRADLTVTFGGPKLGLLRFPARALCGDLEAVEIGFPPVEPATRARVITGAWTARLLGERADDAHKGEAGYVAVVGGQQGMAGAAVLTARAAIRAGAGIVRIVTDPGNREIVQSAVPGALFVPWENDAAVREAVEWADAIVLGPGLGRGSERRALLERVLGSRGETPALLDADALNAWEGDMEALGRLLEGPALLTPHPGEMARLAGVTAAEVIADPLGTARSLAGTLGCVVLLKGAPTWVVEPDGFGRATSLVTAALATGGVGDVLAGVTGAYLAAGLAAPDAAACALFVSGLAAAAAPEPVGHAASDLPDRIPTARAALRDACPGAWPGVLLALPAARGNEREPE